MPAENTAQHQRPRGKPFRKGVSGNPAGKPKGCRNRAAVLLDTINDDDLTAIVTKLVTQAKAGDMTAIKILLDRLVPAPRARAVTLKLPSLAEGNCRSKAAALAAVLNAMAAGDIDPGEAAIIAELVEKVGDASHDCGGLLPPPPLTKEQRERAAKLQEGWPTLQPWPSDLSDLK
jgi:Family of unknown function (DUF5681)